MKQERLFEGKFYHIYNRGNNRRNLFSEVSDYEHFLALYDKYISPIAETLAWVLMPNHFHLVVRIKENVVYKYSNPYQLNADRSGDAVRFADETTGADLSVPIPIAIGTIGNNVGPKGKGMPNQLNADRSIDAVRFADETTGADLSAYKVPDNVGLASSDNIEKVNNNIEERKKDRSWFEDHKWETTKMELFNGVEKPKKPIPHRHFGHLFNAYARYFNKRTDGTGNLFERPFKRKLIHNEQYLKQVILYVHNNPIHHGFCNHLLEYPWSSYITCVSEKPTKLKRERVLKLFNERNDFKNQHNQKIDVEKIEKWLELDEVDYTTELKNQFNAGRSDMKTIETGRFSQFNADRSRNAVRFANEASGVDLSASARPDNVEEKIKEKVRYNQFNADRSGDAVRFEDAATGADLSVPVAIGNNVGQKEADEARFDQFNAVRSIDADRLANEATAADLSVLSVPIAIGIGINVEKKRTPQVIPQVTAQLVPTGREVTPQVTPQVKELIISVKKEMTREEIQKILKFKNRKYFRTQYLQPGLAAGVIEMTIPDKPNSSSQKYRLTEKGEKMKQTLKRDER